MSNLIAKWKSTVDYLSLGPGIEPSENQVPLGFPASVSVCGCKNDSEAVSMWLGDCSKNTWQSYRKSVYRFMAWFHLVKSAPLGMLSFQDWIEYESFLRNVPAEWCSRRSLPFGDFESGYRFFKGSLDERSVIQEKRAVSSLCGWLAQTGYLAGNPFLAERRRSSGESVSQRLTKFTGHTKKAIDEDTFDALVGYLSWKKPKGDLARAKHSRLEFMLYCFFYCGLRVSELCEMSTSSERLVKMNTGEAWPEDYTYVMVVLGKGGKVREIPMHQKVKNKFLDMRDRMKIPMAVKDYEDLPLIPGATMKEMELRNSMLKRYGEETGFRQYLKERARHVGSLNRQAVFKILKGLYSEFAQWLDSQESDLLGLSDEMKEKMKENLKSKGVHSLRHSFGTNMVRTNGIAVTSNLLGHISPVTTMQYVSIGDKASYDAISKIK